ncbi:hypothetical protein MF672_010795 [Actinomadura sp. ATCC 31491]|uniref:Uncharacterized protein n=1 Tax=Actinomadura luzonensis TaxID=2805427 RepID=A0ABT0FPR4_9ACTN|nr:hypothetical protein [Actinomadura luzonensis]MCK2214274.1 hypothetical protein [Actinomadura luzonensis]
MSREAVHLQISASLKRNNGPEDAEHRRLYDDLVQRITAVVNSAEFEPIIAMVMQSGQYWHEE